MFSNSGFTRDALKKANRVGIEMASAMKAKDDTVRIVVHRKVVARRLALTVPGKAVLYPSPSSLIELDETWTTGDLLFDGLPVIHWIAEKTKVLATEHDMATKICFRCTFRPEPRWSYHGLR